VARVVIVRPDTAPTTGSLPLLLLLLRRPLPLALGPLAGALAAVLGRHVKEGGGLRGPGDLEEREARGVALDALCWVFGGLEGRGVSKGGIVIHSRGTRFPSRCDQPPLIDTHPYNTLA
jgi:hypothetical protein